MDLETDEPVAFEKQLVEVQDLQKSTHHSRGICGNIPQINKETVKDHIMPSCNQLDLETDDQLSLRYNNRLKFKTFRKLPIILEESVGMYPNLIKKHRKIAPCNRLDLETDDRLSLRNIRLKFKTFGKLTIILEESLGIDLKLMKEKPKDGIM